MEEERELDDYIRKCLKELPLDDPPADFTSRVMSAVQTDKVYGRRIAYTPVFSRYSWMLIAALAIVLSILGYNTENNGIGFPEFLSFIEENSFSLVRPEKLQFIFNTQIITYSSIALCCFVCLQVFLLKKSWTGRKVIF